MLAQTSNSISTSSQQIVLFYMTLWICQTYLYQLYMSVNRETLKNIVKELRNLDIEQLPPHQMKQWLTKIQQKYQKLTTSQHEQTLRKSKTIRKFHDKSSFKKYIKKRMPAIVNKSLNTVVPIQSANATLDNVKTKGWEQKSKKSIKIYANAKHIRFMSRLQDALKKWSLQELSCPICLQTMVSPALTACGHVFCLECIDESLLFSTACPNCRENIKLSQPLICSALNKLIRAKAFIQQTQAGNFQDRLVKYENWAQRRFLNYNQAAPGNEVDIRDTENIWCRGNIVKVYRRVNKKTGQKKTTALLVHYNRWDKLYNQIIDIPSHRLAPLNCFSNRNDIPRYNLAHDDGNLRGSVITGLTIRNELNTHINLFLRDFNHNHEIVDVDSSDQQSEENFQSEQNELNQEDEQQPSEEESHEQQQRLRPVNQEQQRLVDRGGLRFRTYLHTFMNDYRRDIHHFIRRSTPQLRSDPQQSQSPQQPPQSLQIQIQSDEQPPQYDYSVVNQSSERFHSGPPSQQLWNFDSSPYRISWMPQMQLNDDNEDEVQRQNQNESEILGHYQ